MMATVRKSVEIDLEAELIWDAVRDVGQLHTRVAPAMVTDCRLNADGTERIVTFADGTVLRETIIAIDDSLMRLAWSATAPSLTHHNGAMEIVRLAEGKSSVSWTADVLPHAAANSMSAAIRMGLATMKAHLEKASSSEAVEK